MKGYVVPGLEFEAERDLARNPPPGFWMPHTPSHPGPQCSAGFGYTSAAMDMQVRRRKAITFLR